MGILTIQRISKIYVYLHTYVTSILIEIKTLFFIQVTQNFEKNLPNSVKSPPRTCNLCTYVLWFVQIDFFMNRQASNPRDKTKYWCVLWSQNGGKGDSYVGGLDVSLEN